MKILLTGTAGFIGFHTAKALLDKGEEIIAIDNLNDYYDINLKKARLNILKKYPNFTFIKQNIEDSININESIDVICHLAAQAGVRYSLENPKAYEISNNLGTMNIFEFAKKHNIKSIVYASSSSVYGNSKIIPFTEDQQLDNPISLYAATKKANELYAYTYFHLHNINSIGLRFFTVYGPYGRPDMALFKFTKNILENKPIEVYNKGNLKRDFTYVEDIVQGILNSISLLKQTNKPIYEILNLGRGQPIQLTDFISEIEKNLNKKAEKNLLPMQKGDVKQTYADITKAKNLINYNPQISIQQGIKSFIDWYKEFYNY